MAYFCAALASTRGQPGRAVSLRPAADTAAKDLEIEALLAAQPRWTFSASAQASVGYNDNLLLSHANPASSAFGRMSVESLAWHVPQGSIDYFLFVNGDYTRYASPAEDHAGNKVDHEAQAFAGVEWRYRRADWFTFTLDAQGYYLDQVFDISNTDAERFVSDLKVSGLKIGPTARMALRSWLWIEAGASFDRQKFQDGVNDARLRDGVVRLGWEPNSRVLLTLEGTERRRAFDRRVQFKSNGRPDDDGRLLVVHEREVESRLKTRWGGAKQWTLTTRVGGLEYLDNGSKYLNYRQRHTAQEIEWSRGKWSVHLEGEARRKEYELQTVPLVGALQPQLIKDEFAAEARVERKLSDRWTIVAEDRWERSRSNDEIANYHVNECLLGLRFSWEK